MQIGKIYSIGINSKHGMQIKCNNEAEEWNEERITQGLKVSFLLYVLILNPFEVIKSRLMFIWTLIAKC